MKQLAAAIGLFALLACDRPQPPAVEDLPPVSAPIPPVATHPKVDSCLELVGSSAFAEALPVCREARRLAPRNEEVRAAVQIARAHLAQPEE